MQVYEIRQLSSEEIQQRLDDAREELFNLRVQWASGQLRDNNRLTQVQRDIARMLTILRELELASEWAQLESEEEEVVA
ncbi:MAG: 50S ribosomal protein L29 [Anaerolineae bacterium]|nr:MAG: 50S ribosomal protein L29 [Anaerolineae bacterium]